MKATSSAEVRRMNRATLAKFFGVPVAEVDKWVGQGCPYIKRATGKGDEWIFDSADVANWRLDLVRRGSLSPLTRR